MLLLGYALGMGALGALGVPSALFLVTVVAGFLARHALATWTRLPAPDSRRAALFVWALVYCLALAASVGALVLGYGRWLLVPIGGLLAVVAAASTGLEWLRRDRTAWGELINLVGLSLVTPAAAYVGTGALSPAALGLWLLAVVFFTASVFHVRYLVRRQRSSSGPLARRLRAGAASIAYHVGGLALVAALGAGRMLPPLAAVALLPMVAKALWAVLHRQPGPPSVRRLGFIELAHGVVFVVLAIAVFRLASEA